VLEMLWLITMHCRKLISLLTSIEKTAVTARPRAIY
jgi:hypothetical protein